MITLEPIGWVRGGRREVEDDDWGTVEATIELDGQRFGPDVLAGLDAFSHIEVIFHFDRVDEANVELAARHPRGNQAWPKVGIFAQRAKGRPNRLGLTTCELLGVDGIEAPHPQGQAVDGTPVLDLKPFMAEFAPRGETQQPAWASELMQGYWEA